MSTVVALGHFCEVHGPRLVFYTIRNINEPQFVSQCPDFKFCSGCKAPVLEGYISTVQTVHSTPTPSPLSPTAASSSAGTVHRSSLLAVTPSSESFSQPNGASNSNCHPHEEIGRTCSTTKFYCSHSNYDHSHLSHLQTCIARTLTCEQGPSNSVAFTSSDIWVIGTSFSLKDSQARGFHRKYCLIFTFLPETPTKASLEREPSHKASQTDPDLHRRDQSGHHNRDKKRNQSSTAVSSTDRGLYSDGDKKDFDNVYPSLVPYYDFITEEFYNVAKSLQGECEKVYFKEQAVSPQRAHRLTVFHDGEGPGSSASVGGYRSKVFTRSQSTGARSLPLLSGNPHVFLDLHEKFAKTLHHVDL